MYLSLSLSLQYSLQYGSGTNQSHTNMISTLTPATHQPERQFNPIFYSESLPHSIPFHFYVTTLSFFV